MRNVLALGAAVLFISSVGVAGAQERLPQSSSGSGFGVATQSETFRETPAVRPHLTALHSWSASGSRRPSMDV